MFPRELILFFVCVWYVSPILFGTHPGGTDRYWYTPGVVYGIPLIPMAFCLATIVVYSPVAHRNEEKCKMRLTAAKILRVLRHWRPPRWRLPSPLSLFSIMGTRQGNALPSAPSLLFVPLFFPPSATISIYQYSTQVKKERWKKMSGERETWSWLIDVPERVEKEELAVKMGEGIKAPTCQPPPETIRHTRQMIGSIFRLKLNLFYLLLFVAPQKSLV